MRKWIIALTILFSLCIFSVAYGEKPIKEKLFVGGKEGLYIVKFEKLNTLKVENHIGKETPVITSALEGDYLFVGTENGISIYSLKDPDKPDLLSKFVPKIENFPYPSSYPHKIFIEEERVYIPYGISGILILDIHDKKMPEKIGRYKDGTVFYDVVVKDRYIYTSSSSGLVIINAKNPENPKKVKILIPPEKKKSKFPIYLSLIKGYLFVGMGNTLYVYDMENPEDPIMIKEKKIADLISGLYFYDDYLFIVDDRGFTLRVFKLNISKKKTKKGTNITVDMKKRGIFKSNYPIKSLLYFRDFLYLAMGKYGIEVVNMDSLERIFKKDILNIYTDCVSIGSYGKFMYAVDTKEGLIIMDKEKMIPVNWYGTLRGAIDFTESKKYGYFLQRGRLSSLSIKEDGEPYRIDSTQKVPERAFRIYKEREKLYIAALDYGLFIYDTEKDLTSPELIKKYATDGNLYDIYPDGDVLYIADGKAGFFALNIQDTENIKILRRYKTKSPLISVFKFREILYLGEKDGTLEIISLENPKKIEIIGSIKLTSPIVKIKKWGDYLFLATGPSGIKILKMGSPYSLPKLISEIKTNGYAWDMFYEDKKLWIADGENGVVVYALDNINEPRKLKDLDWFSANIINIK